MQEEMEHVTPIGFLKINNSVAVKVGSLRDYAYIV